MRRLRGVFHPLRAGVREDSLEPGLALAGSVLFEHKPFKESDREAENLWGPIPQGDANAVNL